MWAISSSHRAQPMATIRDVGRVSQDISLSLLAHVLCQSFKGRQRLEFLTFPLLSEGRAPRFKLVLKMDIA